MFAYLIEMGYGECLVRGGITAATLRCTVYASDGCTLISSREYFDLNAFICQM